MALFVKKDSKVLVEVGIGRIAAYKALLSCGRKVI